MEIFGAKLTSRGFGLSIKNGVACKACVPGIEVGSWLDMLVSCALQNGVIASFDSIILSLGLFLEPHKDGIIDKPEGSSSGVGHDMTSLNLYCASGVMKMNSDTTNAL